MLYTWIEFLYTPPSMARKQYTRKKYTAFFFDIYIMVASTVYIICCFFLLIERSQLVSAPGCDCGYVHFNK